MFVLSISGFLQSLITFSYKLLAMAVIHVNETWKKDLASASRPVSGWGLCEYQYVIV